jgi:uncharacterized protein (TIGR01615 family)
MKIQPIDIVSQPPRDHLRTEPAKPVLKSRLKRLFRITPEKLTVGEQPPLKAGEFEPSSVFLDKLVQNFIEESHNEKAKFGRNRCNCFNGNVNESSDDEFDVFGSSESINNGDFTDVLKNLVPCASFAEKNLLADTAMIVEKSKNIKRKDDLRKIVTDHLQSLNYNSSTCKSKWDKSINFPAGEYEYIDVIMDEGNERVLIDIDFRSEFEIARSTGGYKAVLQSLPLIFVGKSDRLAQIVSVVSEAAKLSLKKKGMHFPPWRKAEYMRAKWLSHYTRASQSNAVHRGDFAATPESPPERDDGDFDLIFGEKLNTYAVGTPWKPPLLPSVERPRSAKVVTGLSSLLKDDHII